MNSARIPKHPKYHIVYILLTLHPNPKVSWYLNMVLNLLAMTSKWGLLSGHSDQHSVISKLRLSGKLSHTPGRNGGFSTFFTFWITSTISEQTIYNNFKDCSSNYIWPFDPTCRSYRMPPCHIDRMALFCRRFPEGWWRSCKRLPFGSQGSTPSSSTVPGPSIEVLKKTKPEVGAAFQNYKTLNWSCYPRKFYQESFLLDDKENWY